MLPCMHASLDYHMTAYSLRLEHYFSAHSLHGLSSVTQANCVSNVHLAIVAELHLSVTKPIAMVGSLSAAQLNCASK